ncbi:E3 SUMO-protein ligase ZBED1 [Polypterus senegalus]
MAFRAYPSPVGLGSVLKRKAERVSLGPGLGRPIYAAAVDRRKSKVWNYYTQLNESHVQCNVCKKQLSFHNSTTTMREHLVRRHSIRDNCPPPPNFPEQHQVKEELQEAEISGLHGDSMAKRVRTTETLAITAVGGPDHTSFPPPPPDSSRSASLVTELILEMIYRDLHPLSVVQEKGFKTLLSCMEPSFQIPSPSHLGSLLWHKYNVLKQHLELYFHHTTAPHSVVLCTEHWKVPDSDRFYLSVSTHFIDRNWRMAHCLLETKPVASHEGVLEETLLAILSSFRIPENSVFGVVHDSLTSMQTCARPLQELHRWRSLCCTGNALKLSVREGLTVEPVQQALVVARGIVSYFQHNTKAAEALNPKVEAANKTGFRLVLDEPHNWLTTIDMCENLLELKWVISSVLEEQATECSVTNLADHQWRLLQELVPVLKTVKIAVSFLSEWNNSSVSALMPCLHGVARLLGQQMAECSAQTVRSMIARIRAEMEKHWQVGEEEAMLGNPAVLASFLDPRFKELRFLSPDSRSKLHDKVKDLLSLQAYPMAGLCPCPVRLDELKGEPRGTLPSDSPLSCGSTEDNELILLPQVPEQLGQEEVADEEEEEDVAACPGSIKVVVGESGSAVASKERRTQSMYDILLGEDPTERMPEIHQQLENYIAEPLCKRSMCPLEWWRGKEHRFPVVAKLARQYLAIPATAISAEHAFASKQSAAIQRRATVSSEHLDQTLFLHHNCDFIEALKVNATCKDTFVSPELLYPSITSLDSNALLSE